MTRIRNTRGISFLVFLLSTLQVVLPIEARAHKEPTHSRLTEIAFQYLESYAKAGKAGAALPSGEAKVVMSYLDDLKFTSDDGRLIFGMLPVGEGVYPQYAFIAPGLRYALNWPSLATQSFDTSSPVKKDGTNVSFRAWLGRYSDDTTDTWVSSAQPFQTIVKLTDEELDKAYDAAAKLLSTVAMEKVGDFLGDWAQGCGDQGNWFLEAMCFILFAILFPFIAGLTLAAEMIMTLVVLPIVELILAIDQANGQAEELAGDSVMACYPSTYMMQDVVSEPDPLWRTRGLESVCTHARTFWLPKLDDIRIHGSPASLGGVKSFFRGMMFGHYKRCVELGIVPELEGVTPVGIFGFDGETLSKLETCRANLNNYFAQWRNVILSSAMKVKLGKGWNSDDMEFKATTAQNPFKDYVSDVNNFSAQYHFADLLSPNGVTTPKFTDVATFKKQWKGIHDAIDGYSLGDANVFKNAWGEVSSFDQGKIVDAAKDFNATLAWKESGNTALRRRVGCPVKSLSLGKQVMLETNDGLGATSCKDDTTQGMLSAPFVTVVTRPAHNMALDGWAMWLSGRHPGMLEHGGTKHEVVDFGTAFRDAFKNGTDFGTLMGANKGCKASGAPFTSAFTCADEMADATLETRLAQGDVPEIGFVGLAHAIHAVQDVTVPQHIAPTTGFGHAPYEALFRRWVYNDNAETVATFRDPSSGATSLAKPVKWFSGGPDQKGLKVNDAFFESVTKRMGDLEKTMAELQPGSTCFGIRKLVIATAYHTAKTIEDSEGAGKSALAAPFWVREADAQVWERAIGPLGTKYPTKSEDLDVRGGRVAPRAWGDVVVNTAPFAVAGTVLALKYAVQTKLKQKESCDKGWGDGPPPPPTPPSGGPPPTDTDPNKCIIDGMKALLVKAPKMEKWKALAEARCICLYGKDAAKKAECVGFNVNLWSLLQLYRGGLISEKTFTFRWNKLHGERLGRWKPGARGSCDRDSDCDGVPDCEDQCPNERWCQDPVFGPSGGGRTPVDRSGCSRLVDGDGDGVLDTIDQCKKTKKGQVVNKDGCSNEDLALR
ncbi:MAG: hypothetical protein HYY84_07515 [Deltaproteobacteria bacterium]|nr:hypothetical protein [Deltaproteobacteria bacterium]